MTARDPRLTATPQGTTFEVRVVPKASRCGLSVEDDGRVRVRIDAPPVDGAANDRLVRYLAREVFDVARAQVEILRGDTGRTKLIRVGLPEEAVRGALTRAAGT